MREDPHDPLAAFLAGLGLVDHHVHGALRRQVPRERFESMLTEAPSGPSVGTVFDSQVGFAIRTWCAPLLDLPRHATADVYWARRCELGEDEVNQRLLRATGTAVYLLETGYLGDAVLDPPAHAAAAAARVREVVRLEAVAEALLAESGSADRFASEYPARLAERAAGAVGTKTILAYRHGFDLAPERPGTDAVTRAAGTELARAGGGTPRITDPTLLSYLRWCGVDLGLPLQVHCGYGDPDLSLHRANPLLLTDWLRLVEPTGVPVMLLHNYPFHREAGYLAQVFDNVYFDVGLGVNYAGAASRSIIAESLELGPFHKQVFSSDAWGPAELHLLGSLLWRRGVASVIGAWVDADEWSLADAQRVLRLIASENAERVYRLS
ncbi:amidohydrolase family protein [Propionicicella superfundia]|uniref:amidohydrolase family protein n=1 Tax=Propionicicella superfundia TaxID=348582 RepID=UPI0003FC76CD|nr:amidohydrolase family protein [Propionicicella superfundia]